MRTLANLLFDWPDRVASRYFAWIGPTLARLVVGVVFMQSGWGKLGNLPLVIKNFVDWNIPAPQILAPFVSGVEFVGGVLLLLGLLTRFAGPALAITMVVAIRSALWDQVNSLGDLLGLDEMAYLALFVWLGVAGPGPVSLDHLLLRWYRNSPPQPA
jgi:putative oxidoreductase